MSLIARVLILALVISLGLNVWLTVTRSNDSANAQSGHSLSELTFSTPEEAVTHFFTSAARGEFAVASQACASESIAEHYDLDAFIDRVNAWMPASGWSPTGSDFWTEANALNAQGQCQQGIRMIIWQILMPEGWENTTVVSGDEAKEINEVLDPTPLENAQIVRVDQLDASSAEGSLKQTLDSQCGVLGGQECTDLLILVEVDGRHFSFGSALVNYGEGWQISTPGHSVLSALAGLPVNAPSLTTLEEYESLLDGLEVSLL